MGERRGEGLGRGSGGKIGGRPGQKTAGKCRGWEWGIAGGSKGQQGAARGGLWFITRLRDIVCGLGWGMIKSGGYC